MLVQFLESSSPVEVIATFVALAIMAAFVLSLGFIIIGGISFILSGGDDTKIKAAINTIRFAIIGFVVTFLSSFIVSWIASLLDIPFEISFGLVLEIITELSESMS